VFAVRITDKILLILVVDIVVEYAVAVVRDVAEMWRILWIVYWKMLGLKEHAVKMVWMTHSNTLLSTLHVLVSCPVFIVVSSIPSQILIVIVVACVPVIFLG